MTNCDVVNDETNDISAKLFDALDDDNNCIERVEYLIDKCGVNIEQRVIYKCQEDGSNHFVTPLWYAAVDGKLNLLEFLVKRGANIHCVSDKGSTPVRSACFMNHYHIVKYLIELGADISRPNYSGGTCLINAIQSRDLCQLLLENGAQVNAQDYTGKTALHYAISEKRTKTVLFLIRYGADVYLKNSYGEDALFMACLSRAEHIFEFLLMTVTYPEEHVANAYELIGATFFDEDINLAKALEYWKKALDIRNRNPDKPIRKAKVEAKAVYRHFTEFETEDELDRLLLDVDAVKLQSHLIYERILGKYHHHTIFRLLIRGASYADNLQFYRSISLWRYALELKIEKNKLLGYDTSVTLEQLVMVLLDFYNQSSSEQHRENFFSELLATTSYLIDVFESSMQLLTVRPIFQEHLIRFDSCLKSLTHLLYVLVLMTKTKMERLKLFDLTAKLVQMDLRDSKNKSLLHLVVSRSNNFDNYAAPRAPIFPNASVVKYLLMCGADVNTVDDELCTPLHIATYKHNFDQSGVSALLLEHGAHIDQKSLDGSRPILQIRAIDSEFDTMKYISLKCLAAQAVVMHNVRYNGLVPDEIDEFLKIH